MKLASIAAVLIASAALVSAHSHSNSLAWRQFKQQHEKVYENQEEEARRFAIFMANKQLVDRHNANTSASFTMELNHMSDLALEEIVPVNVAEPAETPLDVITDEELEQILGSTRDDDPLPDEFDWRKVKGRVTDVKAQQTCRASWAFVITGLLEGQELPQNMSKLVPLSEQELIDCGLSNDGCYGGLMGPGLNDLAKKLGGIESEDDYPFDALTLTCRSNSTKFLPLKLKGHKVLPAKDEQTLKRTLVKYGPVALIFQVTLDFINYKGGIFEDKKCMAGKPNHHVLLVGYGKDSKAGDYWIIKNSWDTTWGEQGYVRFKAGTNMCGIADTPIIATF